MIVFGWRLDEGRSPPGCAPLWSWEPVLYQEEMFEVAWEVQAIADVRGRETSETGFPSYFK